MIDSKLILILLVTISTTLAENAKEEMVFVSKLVNAKAMAVQLILDIVQLIHQMYYVVMILNVQKLVILENVYLLINALVKEQMVYAQEEAISNAVLVDLNTVNIQQSLNLMHI